MYYAVPISMALPSGSSVDLRFICWFSLLFSLLDRCRCSPLATGGDSAWPDLLSLRGESAQTEKHSTGKNHQHHVHIINTVPKTWHTLDSYSDQKKKCKHYESRGSLRLKAKRHSRNETVRRRRGVSMAAAACFSEARVWMLRGGLSSHSEW